MVKLDETEILMIGHCRVDFCQHIILLRGNFTWNIQTTNPFISDSTSSQSDPNDYNMVFGITTMAANSSVMDGEPLVLGVAIFVDSSEIWVYSIEAEKKDGSPEHAVILITSLKSKHLCRVHDFMSSNLFICLFILICLVFNNDNISYERLEIM